jgi:cell division cycle protein 20 (cofactor of APC complex)
MAHFHMTRCENQDPQSSLESAAAMGSPAKELYKRQLAQHLFAEAGGDKAKILAFKAKPPVSDKAPELSSMYSANGGKAVSRKAARHVPSAPERILDAPDLLDDYYLNLLDWGSSNAIAIALGSAVYLFNASTGDVSELMSTTAADDMVTRCVFYPSAILGSPRSSTRSIPTQTNHTRMAASCSTDRRASCRTPFTALVASA